jgi:hypothetical protein
MWHVIPFNSFASGARNYSHHVNGKPPVKQIVERSAMVGGLTDLDLNYPDHVEYGNAAAFRGASLMGVRDPFRSAARRHHPWHDGKRPAMNVQAFYRPIATGFITILATLIDCVTRG